MKIDNKMPSEFMKRHRKKPPDISTFSQLLARFFDQYKMSPQYSLLVEKKLAKIPAKTLPKIEKNS